MRFAELVSWLSLKCHSPLVVLRADDTDDSRTFEVECLPAVVGRSSDADVQIADQWVSKVHCCLTIVDGHLVVRDLESRHGTLVNGETVTERELHVGDSLAIGVTEIEVVHIADRGRLIRAQPEPRA